MATLPRAAIYFSPKTRAKAGGIYAAIYCRSATVDQGTSAALDRQEAACRAYAREHGYLVEPVVREVASGLRTDRTGLVELCAMIASGRIDVVLVADLARLSRDPEGLYRTLSTWQAAGVRVIATGGIE